MRGVRPILLLFSGLLGSSLSAQVVVTSQGPEQVAVTVYRDPGSSGAGGMDLDWLEGYALITEQRAVSVPAGESEIRFEGVAGGILPESAIVTGFGAGVVEKNQNAALLSPYSLLDGSLGKRVHIRRTSRTTGAIRETEAIVRTGADGAVVIQTEEGFEALQCTGLPETIVYDRLPDGLTAKPTLSVRVRAEQAAAATVSLSYLSSGFDWRANYVATLDPSGDRMDLFAWVTIANGDETSFVGAQTQAVAGKVNRENRDFQERDEGEQVVALRCWPQGRTSDVPATSILKSIPQSTASFGPPPVEAESDGSEDEDIIVTGAQVVRAEELGDLKLYRVAEPVTVASNSQKQVALMNRPAVKVETLYRLSVSLDGDDEDEMGAQRVLRTRNRPDHGLGLALPAGGVSLFAAGYARPVLLGEGNTRDKAVGEEVEFVFPGPPGIIGRIEYESTDEGEEDEDGRWDALLTVTNDSAEPRRIEVEFREPRDRIASIAPEGARLSRRNGMPLWKTTVPANGSKILKFELRSRERPDPEEFEEEDDGE